MTGENLKNVDFSIIIPVYNSSSYLEQCIQSVLSQTYKNLEIILINDGSTDDSLSICNRLAKGNARVKVFDQKNKGQGSARNLGLKHANGTYILFVDSDDALAENTIELNYQILKNTPSIECLQFPIYMKYGNEEAYLKKGNEKQYKVENSSFNKLILEDNVISWIVCDKIFKKESVIGLNFREDIKYEDNYFMMEYVQKIKNFYLSEHGIYFYYFRENSTTTSSLSELKERSTSEVLYLILSLLNPKEEFHTFYKYLIRLINVEKSLNVNFNSKSKGFDRYYKQVKIKDVLKTKLLIKDKVKILLYKFI